MSLTKMKTKNSLKNFIESSLLIKSIIDEIKLLGNYKELSKGSQLLELIEHVAQIVENSTHKNLTIENKKEIITSVFKEILPEVPVAQIEAQLEYLVNNNIIKKIPFVYRCISCFNNFIQKKFIP